jgi:hypothetical protein
MKATKKRNRAAQDATLINLRAVKAKQARQATALKAIEAVLLSIEAVLVDLTARVEKLEGGK